MALLRRLEPGSIFHVTSRGNNGFDIFPADFDKLDYLGRLERNFAEYKVRLLAYCLMTNHVHLLVQDVTGKGISNPMHRLQGSYARNFNCRHGRTGHVYDKRFYSDPILQDRHLVAASCYIHNNPVKAELVPSATEYAWSSVGSYIGGFVNLPVSTDLVLELCGGRENYRELLMELAGGNSAGAIPADIADSALASENSLIVKEARVFGDDDRRRKSRPRGMLLEEIFRQVTSETGITREEIEGPSRRRHISAGRGLFCAIAKREGYGTTYIAKLINRSPAAVVQLAK